jgi:GDP-L-fucose synthase
MVAEFASLVAETVGYNGKFVYDTSKPDGAPQRLLDVSKLRDLGWSARTSLRLGLAQTYAEFLATSGHFRSAGINNRRSAART